PKNQSPSAARQSFPAAAAPLRPGRWGAARCAGGLPDVPSPEFHLPEWRGHFLPGSLPLVARRPDFDCRQGMPALLRASASCRHRTFQARSSTCQKCRLPAVETPAIDLRFRRDGLDRPLSLGDFLQHICLELGRVPGLRHATSVLATLYCASVAYFRVSVWGCTPFRGNADLCKFGV